MRDLNITLRNSLGQVKFGVEANNTPISEVEVLIQKIQILLLSKYQKTILTTINGAGINEAGKFTFGDSSYDSFKVQLSNSLDGIESQIKKDDVLNNVPVINRLKNLSLYNIIYDKLTNTVLVEVMITTNLGSTLTKLPVSI